MRILLFAHLRDVAGCAEMNLPLSDIDVEGLWRELTRACPRMAVFQSSVRLARNGVYVGVEERFCESDEIALIPPVSGG